jgi:hypothetical protein
MVDRNHGLNKRHTPVSARKSSRGSALLTVLWLSAGLGAIALSTAFSVRAETDRVSTSAEGLRAWYLAQGAVERGIQWMIWGSRYRRADSSPMFWDFSRFRYTMAFPSGTAVLEAIPEASKLNINQAPPEDLYKVVFAVSGDENRSRLIVDSILDWRSPAQAPTPFDQFYSSIRPTFRARHASFVEIEELLFVRGMSPELFYGNYAADSSGRLYARGGLRDCLSVWGSLGPFDVNTASPALMEAMGTPSEVVGAVVARRLAGPINQAEVFNALVPQPTRLTFAGGYATYTLRATARLLRPDGSFSDAVRTAGATVRMILPNPALNPAANLAGGAQVRVLRSYDDVWSQDINPPGPGMPLPLPSGNPFMNPLPPNPPGVSAP